MLWHYTSVVRLKEILNSGVLRTNSYEGERPAVWFSSNQIWEATACKRVNDMTRRLTFEEQDLLIGCARVGVERADLLSYRQWAEGVSPEFAVSLALGGYELGGDPREWFASLEPVTNRDWRSVQVWLSHGWVNFEEIL